MKKAAQVRYLIPSEQDTSWGITISTVGFQTIDPCAPYPTQNHPDDYYFSTDKGRILDEYQIIYIPHGSGTFLSRSSGARVITEGDMFLLFPGEWHTYKPDPSTGWSEYWIGFKGKHIDSRVEAGFFSPADPVHNIGIREETLQLFSTAVIIAKQQKMGFQQMLAGIVNMLLGFAYGGKRQSQQDDSTVIKQINRAKVLMTERMQNDISLEKIASQIGMGYSWFRKIFKEYTGFSPMQYIIELRLQRSKQLLANTDHNSQEIAFEVGFESPHYFCLVFKRRTGMAPLEYRRLIRGRLMEDN